MAVTLLITTTETGDAPPESQVKLVAQLIQFVSARPCTVDASMARTSMARTPGSSVATCPRDTWLVLTQQTCIRPNLLRTGPQCIELCPSRESVSSAHNHAIVMVIDDLDPQRSQVAVWSLATLCTVARVVMSAVPLRCYPAALVRYALVLAVVLIRALGRKCAGLVSTVVVAKQSSL